MDSSTCCGDGTAAPSGQTSSIRLGHGAKGFRGIVVAVGPAGDTPSSPEQEELNRRLLEIGFVEGAKVEILHEGWIGRDPIAIKLDDMRVALRRHEANNVLVRPSAEDSR